LGGGQYPSPRPRPVVGAVSGWRGYGPSRLFHYINPPIWGRKKRYRLVTINPRFTPIFPICSRCTPNQLATGGTKCIALYNKENSCVCLTTLKFHVHGVVRLLNSGLTLIMIYVGLICKAQVSADHAAAYFIMQTRRLGGHKWSSLPLRRRAGC
jgi:hypothetical protein